MRKRITETMLCLAAVMLLMIAMCVVVYADETEGDEVTWTQMPNAEGIEYYLDEEGALMIQGEGEMPDYDWGGSPFYRNADIRKVVIKDGITRIGDYTFNYCTSLSSVEFPDGLETIGKYAFYNCSSIRSIVLPDSLTTLGEYAFSNCYRMKSAVLSRNLKVIDCAFSYCAQLKSVTIPDGVESMGYAFCGCADLKKVTIPASVNNMEWSFGECYGLEEVTFEGDCPTLDGAFWACSLTARYPYGNDTWTDEALDSGYGGKVKWEGYCITHAAGAAVKENQKEATALKAGSYDKVVYCSVCGEELSRQTVAVARLTPTIKLSATKKTVKKGKTYTLKVTGLARDDAVKSFKTSKKSIATVTAKGKITAKKKGKAVITVTLKSGKTAKCTITVK